MRTKLISVFGIAISAVIIIYMTAQFDLVRTQEIFGAAKLPWLVLAAVIYLLLFPLRGLRWSWLLADIKPIGVSSSTQTLVIGAMANNILPARLGDVVRAFLMSRRAGVPATATFSNVLLERIIDGCTVIALLSGVLVFAPPENDWVGPLGITMASLFFVALAACILLAIAPKIFWTVAGPLVDRLPIGLAKKVRNKLTLLLTGIKILTRPGLMLRISMISIVIWGSEVAVYVVCQEAFGLNLPIHGAVLVMSVLTLGLTAPSGPGFVGVFEGLIVAGVSLYGVTPSEGLAFAIAMHLIHYLPVTVLGVVFVWRTGLQLRQLGSKASQTVATSTGGA
jgi:glycosyltransferase 2 family protein